MTDTLTTEVNGYIELPVTTDPTTLQENALAAIAAELPGWVPREGHIEVLLLEQFAAMVAESATVAAQVPEAIFSYFGALIGITPIQGAYATAQSTWTMADNKGYTVPAGTVVGYQVLGNQVYLFSNVTGFTVPNGSTTTAPGAVTIQAQNVGTAYNGLTAQTLTLITSLSYISSVVTTTTSTGGADQETTPAYLNRLSYELQLLTPRPILPADYAALAASFPGVDRAAAFSGLNPFANILVAADSTFGSGSSTWTAIQNGTKSTGTGSYGESTLKMTAGSAGTDMIGETGSYSISQLENWLAMVTLDVASAAVESTVGVNVYDVNDSLITTFTSAPMVDSTTKLSYLWIGFESPANAYTAKVFVDWTTPATGATHQVINASLTNIPAPTNLVPDSSFDEVVSGLTWIGTGTPGANPPGTFTVTPVVTGQNQFTYTGTGSASGSTVVAHSLRTLLPAGTYLASAIIDGTYTTVGGAQISVTNDSAAVLASVTQSPGVKGSVGATFTLGSATVVQFNYTTNNCTVTSGLELNMYSPQINVGVSAPVYTPGPVWTAAGLITNNERMVTVAAVDASGDALSTLVANALSAYLESLREVNFVVNVIGPSYNPIDVQWSGVSTATANPTTVLNAANAALNAYLSPANWAGGTATPPTWDPTQTVVRYLSIVTLLGETPGMDHLTSVYISAHGDATIGTSDVDMIGIAPLPEVGTITGNVTTH